VFEHLTAMRQLSRRERWGRRIERQRPLRPRLTAGSRAFDAGTKTAEANRMTRADVVGFVLHTDLFFQPSGFAPRHASAEASAVSAVALAKAELPGIRLRAERYGGQAAGALRSRGSCSERQVHEIARF